MKHPKIFQYPISLFTYVWETRRDKYRICGGCLEKKNSKTRYLKKYFLYQPFSSDGTKICLCTHREGTLGNWDSHSFNLCLNVVSVYRFAFTKSTRYPLIKRRGGSHIRSGPSEEDINLLPLPGIRNFWQKVVYKKRTRHSMPYARLWEEESRGLVLKLYAFHVLAVRNRWMVVVTLLSAGSLQETAR
jgi:hypothetical protein